MSNAGNHASLPPMGWSGTTRRTPDRPLEIRFISRDGSESATFDFARLNCAGPMQTRFAEAFAKATGSGGSRKTVDSVKALRGTIGVFVASLNGHAEVPQTMAEVKRKHVDTFALEQPAKAARNHLSNLRLLARKGAFDSEAKTAILSLSLPPDPHDIQPSYTDQLVRRIERVARADVRDAYRRITQARELAARYERDELEPDDDAPLAAALGYAREHGTEPPASIASRAGLTPNDVMRHLHLSRLEATAFMVLLVALTGANASTIERWPAQHFRADALGDSEPAVAVIRSNKPRLGRRSRFNKVLIDLPEFTAEVEVAEDASGPSFRTGAMTYLNLVDLTQDTRALSGKPHALQYFTSGTKTNTGYALKDWATSHAFTVGQGVGNRRGSEVSLSRLRRHSIERTHRPNDNSPRTVKEKYLARSERTIEEGFSVVRDALEEQERRARERPMTVLADAPDVAADLAPLIGTSVTDAEAVLAGQLDTVATACVGFKNSPYSPPGEPCAASFLTCLDCVNARALPQHLPAQVALHDALLDLRATTDLERWVAHFATRVTQLADIISHYSPAEVQQARASVTDAIRNRVERLLGRHLEVR